MIDLTNFRITKFLYPFSTDQLGEMIWDKMDEQESKWAVKLTLNGINDTGDNEISSWDLFFLDDRLQEKIEGVLKKYDVPYRLVDQTDLLIKNPDLFSDSFCQKLLSYLSQNLTVDDVLDHILEVGVENITVFEKYFLNHNNENKEEDGI
jgi:hypothetical protein